MVLLALCDDSLYCVSKYLPFYDRLALSQLCRRLWSLLQSRLPRCVSLANAPPERVLLAFRWLLQNAASLLSLNVHGYNGDLGGPLQELAERSPKLEVLNLQHSHRLSSEALVAVAGSLANTLKQLSLWDTGLIHNTALITLVQTCKHLEVLDLRGQSQADDAMMEALGAHGKLKKISLAGTSVSTTGFTRLNALCRNTVVRLGCIGLEPADTPSPTETIYGPELRELQIGFSRARVWIDFNLCPKLQFLGASGCSDLGNIACWRDLCAGTSVNQITLDNYLGFPDEVLSALEAIAPRLLHLSLISDVRNPKFKAILSKCTSLRQLAVHQPDEELLSIIAGLPALTHARLTVDPSCLDVLNDTTIFPSLQHLYLDFSTNVGTQLPKVLEVLHRIPHLHGLYLCGRGWGRGHILSVLKAFPHSLSVLSLSEDFEPHEFDGVVKAIGAMAQLRRLYLPGHLHDCLTFLGSVLPNIEVLGPVRERGAGNDLFSSWMVLEGGPGSACSQQQSTRRCIRRHDPYGYRESDAVKPFDEFLSFIDEDIDPIFPVAHL